MPLPALIPFAIHAARVAIPWVARRVAPIVIGAFTRKAAPPAAAVPKAGGAAAFRRAPGGAPGVPKARGGAAFRRPGPDAAGGGLIRGGKILNILWAGQAAIDLYNASKNLVPGFTHAITVSVVGGPGADLRRIWYLALSAAFGRYRGKAVGYQDATLSGEWDVTNKAVAVSIMYSNNGLIAAIDRILGGAKTPIQLIQEGPTQATVGAGWPAFLVTNARPPIAGGLGPVAAILGGAFGFFATPLLDAPSFKTNATLVFPCGADSYAYAPLIAPNLVNSGVLRELISISAVGRTVSWRGLGWRLGWSGPSGLVTLTFTGGIPVLPDDGRVITTGEKNDPNVQNPKPPVDGVSRGGTLALAAQALQTPCYCVPRPPCIPSTVSQASTGVYVYEPGANQTEVELNNTVRIFRARADYTTTAIAGGATSLGWLIGSIVSNLVGPDGYALPTGAGFTVPRGHCKTTSGGI